MDKQSLSETISKVKKYTKDLKYQVSISNPQLIQQLSSSTNSNYYDTLYSQTNTLSFNKTKAKIESLTLVKQSSPMHSKAVNISGDKSMLGLSSKMPSLKKEVQSENERENAFHKSQNRIPIKHLSNLLAGSLGSRQPQSKKNGHAHTYTHLNDVDSDKFSQIQNSFSMKNKKISRIRHSKSPSKERHIQHNNTMYAEGSYKLGHQNHIHLGERSCSQQKEYNIEVGSLLVQINQLEEVIKMYKSVIMQMKHKYYQMESKLKEKAINDHFVDVLKQQIQDLQDRNNALNYTLSQQQKLINGFQNILINKITKINQHYSQKLQNCIELTKQNEILKEILLIQTSKYETQRVQQEGKCHDFEAPQRNSFLDAVCKSAQRFNDKWA